MAFLAQFYCTPERLNLAGTQCVQLYQCRDVGMGGDPVPVAIRVAIGSEPNSQKSGIVQPSVGQYDISWLPTDDPDVLPDGPDPTEEELQLTKSKVGGIPYFADNLTPGETYLLQLKEGPADFNFAGRMVVVSLGVDDDLHVSLE
jgi:hypothetical protein